MSMPSATSEPPRRPTTAQVLLGLFVVGQLGFLFTANLLGLLESARPRLKDQAVIETLAPGYTRETGHVHDAVNEVIQFTRRWGELTGQPQSWSLFAPNVTTQIPFVVVQLRWDEEYDAAPAPSGGELLRSENEPADVRRYFRIGRFRLRRVESALDVGLHLAEGKTVDWAAPAWRERILSQVRDLGPEIHAYLRWRLRQYRQVHPDTPEPRQVVLWERMYVIPAPDASPTPWDWQLNSYQPVARWRPGTAAADDRPPLEAYDPVARRFTAVPKDG